MKVAIKSLRIVGCGPIDDLELDFTDASGAPRPMTLIGGANGSGKTTVLEVLYGLPQLIGGVRHSEILTRGDECSAILEIDGFEAGIRSLDGATRTPVSRDPIGDHEQLKLLTQSISEQRTNTYDLILNTNTPQGGKHLAPTIVYFPHLRALQPTKGKRVESGILTYDWAQKIEINSEFRGSLNSYFVWTEYAEYETFERIRSAISDLFPDGRTIEIDRKRITAVVVLPNGNRHDLDQLSSGEQNLLIILIELRRRLLPGSIVLIDEIENSLHPAYQYLLVKSLKRLQASIDFQLIATSHSKTMLDAFGADSTLVLPVGNRSAKTYQTAVA